MIAAGFGLMLVTGPLAWLSSIAGIVLLFIIFAYDREGYRSVFQSLAFSVVCGFSLVLAAAAGLRFWATHNESSGPNAQLAVESFTVLWLPLIWACGSVIFWGIDRARMKSREAPSAQYDREPVRHPRGMFDIGDTPVIRPAELPTNERPSAPQSAAVASVAQVAPEPVPQPVPMPQSVPMAQTVPMAQPVDQGRVLARPGKEAMVYVGLVGEGLNVMRSVRAEHMGRSFYRIVESMPEGETWEYGPGQIVRCEKKRLSSGKALVAVEEAPRKA
jgi:hypothetical protein